MCSSKATPLLLAVMTIGFAQLGAQPAFDVGSVKPTPPNARGGGYQLQPSGRLVVTNFTLKNLIMIAWHLQEFQIIGGPSWVDSERYDVEAKAEGAANEDQQRMMLRLLLTDRFQLTIHMDTRDMPIYSLEPFKRDARPAPGLAVWKEGTCEPLSDPSAPPVRPQRRQLPPCGLSQHLKPQDNGARLIALDGIGVNLDMLARSLGTILRRPVTNDSGIQGNFTLSLSYKPDSNPGNAPDLAASDANGPSLFDALQDQLGLKLESKRGPVDVLVIDHLERLSPN